MRAKDKRDGFSSTLAVFFATLSSAIGLGNIWKFPYVTGQNGGAAFIVVYMLCIFLLAIPLVVAEFYIGRKTRKNVIGAYKVLGKNSGWQVTGYISIIAVIGILVFYTAVGGWIYRYLAMAIKGSFNNLRLLPDKSAADYVQTTFSSVVAGDYSPALWQLAVLVVITIVIISGIKDGIERITKVLIPILLMLIIVCDIVALNLQSAPQGLRFLFYPDFSQINGKVVIQALGLAFFKMALGSGTLITYSSYFTDDTDLIGTTVKVASADTAVSILAGIAIFPVVFQFGLEPTGGAGLLFQTIPLAFIKLPFGNMLLIIFLLIAAMAATMAAMSMVEVLVAATAEQFKISRTTAAITSMMIIYVIGVLTIHPAIFWGSANVLGKSFFDFFDFITSWILLPLGGIIVAIFVGWFIEKGDFENEVTNNGTLHNIRFVKFILFLLRYFIPVLIAFVMAAGLR